MKERLPGNNTVGGRHRHKADVAPSPRLCGGLQSSRRLSTLLGQVQGPRVLPDPRGSVVGPQGSCWSWLALPKASSSILTLLARLILTWSSKHNALFRWIPGSRGALQGQPGHFSRVWAPHLSPRWGIRLPSLLPSVGLGCAGQPVPAQSNPLPTDRSSLKDGVRCPRLLPEV